MIEHHGDGGSRDDKFERDRALLEAELERDPDNERATFYLAQTLRDMALTDEAIELYRRRVELGGWDEEVFYAALQVALLTGENNPEGAIPLFLSAFERRPTRAEPLHEAAYSCRRLGWHESAYTFAKRATEIPEPADILFVGTRTYRWGALFEFALAAHNIERHDEALRAYQELLDGRELPEPVEGSIRENMRRLDNVAGKDDPASRLTEPALSDLVPSTRLAEIKLEVDPDWPQFNPSIAADGDGFRAIVRTSNYRLDRGTYSTLDGSGVIRTINYLAKFDRNLSLLEVEPLIDLEDDDGLPWQDFPVQGWEDCRLFEVEGNWYATATSRELDPDGVCRTVLLTLDGARISAGRVLAGPDPHRHEKNWMPHVADGELMFIYSCGPTVVMRVDPDAGDPERIAEHEAPELASNFRGGSQGIAVEGGVLACIHEAMDFGGPRRYLHRWVKLDSGWRLDRGLAPVPLLRQRCRDLHRPRQARRRADRVVRRRRPLGGFCADGRAGSAGELAPHQSSLRASVIGYSVAMASEQGFNRRKFIASGVALGGSVLWAPSFSAARGASIVSRIQALRDDVAGNNVKDERLLKSMLSKLDRAIDAAKEGDDDLVCSLLKKFVQVTNQNVKTDDNGITVREERAWKQTAREIRERCRLRRRIDGPHRSDRTHRPDRTDRLHRADRCHGPDRAADRPRRPGLSPNLHPSLLRALAWGHGRN